MTRTTITLNGQIYERKSEKAVLKRKRKPNALVRFLVWHFGRKGKK